MSYLTKPASHTALTSFRQNRQRHLQYLNFLNRQLSFSTLPQPLTCHLPIQASPRTRRPCLPQQPLPISNPHHQIHRRPLPLPPRGLHRPRLAHRMLLSLQILLLARHQPPIHPMITRSRHGIFKPNPRYALVSATTAPSLLPKTFRSALKDPHWQMLPWPRNLKPCR